MAVAGVERVVPRDAWRKLKPGRLALLVPACEGETFAG